MRSRRRQGRGVPGLRALKPIVPALLCAFAGAALLSAPDPSGAPPMVVVQLPVSVAADLEPSAEGMLPAGWGDGARIVLVAPGKAPRNLTAGFASAADPEISFDGRKMLFAGKRAAGDPWRIFEVELAGGEPRQVTSGPGNHRSPVYLGSFYTIDSPEPWDQLAFVSDQGGELDEFGGGRSTSLYTARLDGSEVHRITFNPSSDLAPTVLPDGRLLFSSWQRAGLSHGPRGRISLFASQTDGLDYALFAGDEGLPIKMMPAVTTDRKVVFVEGERLPWDGAGRLAVVSLRRNLHSHRPLTGDSDGLFLSPSPLPGGGLLASRRPAGGGGSHAVVRVDTETGRWEELFDDPAHHDLQPRAVLARPRPDGRSSVVSAAFDHGILYGLNVYISDLGKEWVRPGTPLRLRVLEGIPRRAGGEARDPEGGPGLIPRRFLGEIPVEEDGSFQAKVPVGIPIQLQLVDEDGMAVRSCDWIWVRNRETRGCIGCHEDGERTPPNRFVSAVSKPPVDLTLPPERRRTVDFLHDVHPILQARCSVAACHGSDGAAPQLEVESGEARRAYTSLLDSRAGWDPPAPPLARYVHPGQARTSPLVSSLFGREVARPWDVEHEPCTVPPMPPAGWEPLTDDERRTLVEWIDLGASWSVPHPGDQP